MLVTLHEEVRELIRPSAGAPRSGAGRPVTGAESTARASKANVAVNYRKLGGVREFRDRSWL